MWDRRTVGHGSRRAGTVDPVHEPLGPGVCTDLVNLRWRLHRFASGCPACPPGSAAGRPAVCWGGCSLHRRAAAQTEGGHVDCCSPHTSAPTLAQKHRSPTRRGAKTSDQMKDSTFIQDTLQPSHSFWTHELLQMRRGQRAEKPQRRLVREPHRPGKEHTTYQGCGEELVWRYWYRFKMLSI